MEDIVAVEVRLDTGERRYFLTWGRVQDAVDPTPLEALVLRHCGAFSLGGAPISAHVCPSLQAAAGQPYFYECFFAMCLEKVPHGAVGQQWIEEMEQAMAAGKELYYLGRPSADVPV